MKDVDIEELQRLSNKFFEFLSGEIESLKNQNQIKEFGEGFSNSKNQKGKKVIHLFPQKINNKRDSHGKNKERKNRF